MLISNLQGMVVDEKDSWRIIRNKLVERLEEASK